MGAECLVHQTTGHGVTVLQQRLLLVKMQQNQLRTGPAVVGFRQLLPQLTNHFLDRPRRARHWAKSYKDRAARLEREGKMHPAGLRSIEESKRNGMWNFMDDVDALIIPDDLRTALESHHPGLVNFEASAPSYRRNVLRWIKLAKTDKTRAKRIKKAAEFAARDEKIPQM